MESSEEDERRMNEEANHEEGMEQDPDDEEESTEDESPVHNNEVVATVVAAEAEKDDDETESIEESDHQEEEEEEEEEEENEHMIPLARLVNKPPPATKPPEETKVPAASSQASTSPLSSSPGQQAKKKRPQLPIITYDPTQKRKLTQKSSEQQQGSQQPSLNKNPNVAPVRPTTAAFPVAGKHTFGGPSPLSMAKEMPSSNPRMATVAANRATTKPKKAAPKSGAAPKPAATKGQTAHPLKPGTALLVPKTTTKAVPPIQPAGQLPPTQPGTAPQPKATAAATTKKAAAPPPLTARTSSTTIAPKPPKPPTRPPNSSSKTMSSEEQEYHRRMWSYYQYHQQQQQQLYNSSNPNPDPVVGSKAGIPIPASAATSAAKAAAAAKTPSAAAVIARNSSAAKKNPNPAATKKTLNPSATGKKTAAANKNISHELALKSNYPKTAPPPRPKAVPSRASRRLGDRMNRSFIQKSIPPHASGIFQVYGRRINLEELYDGGNTSIYSLMRAWVEDDPFRKVPHPLSHIDHLIPGVGGDPDDDQAAIVQMELSHPTPPHTSHKPLDVLSAIRSVAPVSPNKRKPTKEALLFQNSDLVTRAKRRRVAAHKALQKESEIGWQRLRERGIDVVGDDGGK